MRDLCDKSTLLPALTGFVCGGSVRAELLSSEGSGDLGVLSACDLGEQAGDGPGRELANVGRQVAGVDQLTESQSAVQLLVVAVCLPRCGLAGEP